MGFFQAKILEWAAISFSRDLPDPGMEPWSPTLQADSLLSEPPGKPQIIIQNLKHKTFDIPSDVVHLLVMKYVILTNVDI